MFTGPRKETVSCVQSRVSQAWLRQNHIFCFCLAISNPLDSPTRSGGSFLFECSCSKSQAHKGFCCLECSVVTTLNSVIVFFSGQVPHMECLGLSPGSSSDSSFLLMGTAEDGSGSQFLVIHVDSIPHFWPCPGPDPASVDKKSFFVSILLCSLTLKET